MPRDLYTITKIRELHPSIQNRVTKAIDRAEQGLAKNMAIRIVQGYRTFAEQNGLFALGRTKKNPDGVTPQKPLGQIVTNATGGKSIHNYRLATDFALLLDNDGDGRYETLSWSRILDLDKDGKMDWQEVVDAFKFYGAIWGGDWRTFKDYPHCDFSNGKDWRYYLDKYNRKDFIPGTDYLNLP